MVTDGGERRIADLQPGDRVWSKDDGYQPIRCVGMILLDGANLAVMPDLLKRSDRHRPRRDPVRGARLHHMRDRHFMRQRDLVA
ncbi:MAG: hypothetical protein P3W94_006605 [Paracoccus sp. (in: a-proteobacteria)]|nr:hypothetical protein [Paracoccus sp. (in: a-proteobacteria)]